MTSGLLSSNILAYSVQVLALVAAGGLLPALFRIRHSRAHLGYLQVLLAASLLLPLLQKWQRPMITVTPAATSAAEPSVAPAAALIQRAFRWEDLALWGLAGGAALSALWLLLGVWRLRKYRVQARPAYPLPAPVAAAQQSVGAEAVVCVSDDVSGPVTFGFRTAVVLLPPRFLELPRESQFAIACHEFLHVRRGDWLWSFFEELAGILLWFHPAAWWLRSQIRLAREQAVDREVLALTRAPQKYIDALLAMTTAGRPDLAPAPLFICRHHLAQRIHTLLKEVTVPRSRLIASYGAASFMVAAIVCLAVLNFPLRGAPQAIRPDSPGVSVDAGGKLLHRDPVEYPPEAMRNKIEGSVTVEAVLDAQGNVADARALSGPQELRKAAILSVLSWHYASQGSTPGTVKIAVDFRLPPASPETPAREPGGGRPAIAPVQAQSTDAARVPPLPMAINPDTVVGPYELFVRRTPLTTTSPDTPGTLERIDLSALPETLRETLRASLASYEGQPFSNELMNRIRGSVRQVDAHVGFLWRQTAPGQFSLTLSLSRPSAGSLSGVATEPQLPPPEGGVPRVLVGGLVQAARLTNAPPPEYPALARQARIQGTVRFTVLIGQDGRVRDAQVLNGHPLLVPAAQAAIKDYVYQPTYLNDKPVEVVTQADIDFVLPK